MKSIKFKKIVASLGLFLAFTFFASSSMNVSAAGMWDAQIGSKGENSMGSWFGQNSGTPDDLRLTILRIINVALTLLAVIFLVLTVIAGFLWMTSGGDPKKIEEAMGYLKNAVIGLVIILVSKGVTLFFLERMLNVVSGQLYP